MVRYNTIKYNDIANGDGVGISIYFQGCPFHCPGCFNQETWDYNGGHEWTDEVRDIVLKKLNINGLKRHLSLLGGEPLIQRNLLAIEELCRLAKEQNPDIKIYVWTGHTMEELNERLAKEPLLKLIYDNYISTLITGRYEEDKRDITLKLRGSSNQQIWNIK